MKPRRFWMETILTAVGLSCALGLLIATVGAAAGTANGEPQSEPARASSQTSTAAEETYDGMITDTQCGAKHRASIGKTASDCARSCVHAGAQFALIDGDNTYILTGDTELLKHAAGSRARVLGTRHGDTIAVASIIPAS